MTKRKNDIYSHEFPKGNSSNSPLTDQQVREWLQFEGMELVNTYQNNRTELVIICRSKHTWKTNWRAIRSSNYCPDCYTQSTHLDSGKISARLGEIGYELLEAKGTDLISAKCKVCGHSKRGTLHDIERKPKCRECGRRKLIEAKGKDVAERLSRIGLVMIEYTGASRAVKISCPKGCRFTKSPNVINALSGCPNCQWEDYVRSSMQNLNYKVFSIKNDRIVVECPKGHTREISFRHRLRSVGCPLCNSSFAKSKEENQIAQFIRELGIPFEQGNLNLIPPLQLDVYIPSHKLAIEYHGLYWHREDIKGKTNHYRKFAKSLAKGIQTLQFWEDEWRDRPDIVKSIIQAKLGITGRRVYARACQVVEPKREDTEEFLERSHIQGSCPFINSIGLVYQGQLVIVATVSHHHRRWGVLILSRVCTALNTIVVGGFSKLMSEIPRPILTWSDNRYSSGSIYRDLGFTLEEELSPDYQYVAKVGPKLFRVSKQSLKKTEEEKWSGLTEKELREKSGYFRIWDAGKRRWSIK